MELHVLLDERMASIFSQRPVSLAPFMMSDILPESLIYYLILRVLAAR